MLCAMTFALFDGQVLHELDATPEDGRVSLSSRDLRDALGWELKPEGLCRGAVCIPVRERERERLVRGDRIDLERLAELLDRPLAIDADAGLAALAESPGRRAEAMDRLVAPDFTLPDLAGTPHSLSQQRGKKVLLIAYASW
jgi:hypothetical protein